jgi:hypothetical protein
MAAGASRTFVFWFGSVWLALGLVFLVLAVHFGSLAYDLGRRLDREGVSATGLVLAKKITGSRSGYGSDPNPSFFVTLRFTTLRGETVKGEVEVTRGRWGRLIERSPIEVRYLPDAPDRFRVDGQRGSWLWLFVFAVLGVLFTLGGGLVLVLGPRKVARHGPAHARPTAG